MATVAERQGAGDARRPSDVGHLPRLLEMLLALTVVSGLVDAASFLALGRVFVANMTGNVVFLGFASAGASGLSVAASLVALLAFMAGGYLTGRFVLRSAGGPNRVVRAFASLQLAVFVVTAAFAFAVPIASGSAALLVLVGLLGVAMGAQNAGARHLRVPDLSTTVLTQTVTAIAVDPARGGSDRNATARRFLAVAAMLAGAFAGAWLVLHVGLFAPLAAASVLVAVVGGLSWA
ncbi:MAG TPA: YoaK family protein [Thermoplasmata archaeon]|nr:YoaK family protein [Thermoplasmata archaeon]